VIDNWIGFLDLNFGLFVGGQTEVAIDRLYSETAWYY
jgi:hypothetical protein